MATRAPSGEETETRLTTSKPSRRLVTQQGQNLSVLRKAAVSSIYYAVAGSGASLDAIKDLDALLATKHELHLPRRPVALVEAWWNWLSFAGRYEAKLGELPVIMFSQWAFPTVHLVASKFPFAVSSMLNQGCRVQCNHVIPADANITVRASVVSLEDKGKKLRCEVLMQSGTEEHPDAVEATVISVVPKPKSKWTDTDGAKSKKRDPAEVEEGAVLLATIKLPARTGVDFGMISGDFNPIHTSSIYARIAGFKTRFIQGFGSQALIMSILVNELCDGDQARLKVCDLRFIAPVYFPADVAVYVEESASDEERKVWLASPTSGKVFVLGTFVSE